MRRQLDFHGTNGDALPQPWTTSFTASGSAAVQSNAAKLSTPTTTSSFARMYWREWGSHQIDILVRVTPGQAWSTDAFLDVGVRSILDTAPRFYMEIHGAAANNATLVRNDGTTSTIQVTTSVTLTASNPVWVRFRKIGNWTAFKVWDDGTNEPIAWTASVFDTASVAAGTTLLVPWFQAANSTTVTAVAAHSFDSITIDDLQPVKARLTGRRL